MGCVSFIFSSNTITKTNNLISLSTSRVLLPKELGYKPISQNIIFHEDIAQYSVALEH